MKTQILHLTDFQNFKIMKKLLIAVGIVTVLASCSQKKDNQREMLFLTDTTGLYMSNLRADTAIAVEEEPVAVAPTPRRTSTAPVRRTSSRSSSVSSGTSSSSSSGTVATAPAKKEGWSKAAKGAVIGGVTGAAAGAVIGKNAKGAIIGGVIGAGGGYIIGRSKDKKDGRVQ